MTKNQFHEECLNRCIDTDIALENEELCQALRDRDDDAVIAILNEQF